MGAADLAVTALEELLSAAPSDLEALQACLEAEFEALKVRNIDEFESLQPGKTALLERLALAAQFARGQTPTPVVWQQLEDALLQSRDAHLRNAQLLQRQLDAVRAALQAMQGEAPTVDVYDRMGQIAHGSLRGGYQTA
jgi:flagellar biosynthesis/type III secretory pathway chaperone